MDNLSRLPWGHAYHSEWQRALELQTESRGMLTTATKFLIHLPFRVLGDVTHPRVVCFLFGIQLLP